MTFAIGKENQIRLIKKKARKFFSCSMRVKFIVKYRITEIGELREDIYIYWRKGKSLLFITFIISCDFKLTCVVQALEALTLLTVDFPSDPAFADRRNFLATLLYADPKVRIH